MTPPDSGDREVTMREVCNECGAPKGPWWPYCTIGAGGGVHATRSTLAVAVPLDLAQRILAAMEECGEVVGPGIIFPRHTALADELRAIVERKT